MIRRSRCLFCPANTDAPDAAAAAGDAPSTGTPPEAVHRPQVGMLFVGAAAAGLACCLFAWPQTVFESLLAGFSLAFGRVIPAVFPMMVVSALVLESPLAVWLGLPLLPYTRLLGIRDRSAASVLFLGLLGGFAVLAQGIDRLYRARRIDREQAGYLLCAGLNAGPSFVLLSVGYSLLGSPALGRLLLAALLLGNLSAALLLKAFAPRRRTTACARFPQTALQSFPRRGLFTQAMQCAVRSSLTLCGYIGFFALLCALLRQLLPAAAAGGLAAVLEVTNGVVYAAGRGGAYRCYAVLAVLCWSGVSIHLQARALLPEEVSLRTFYCSRPLALLLCGIFYALGVRLFPAALASAAMSVRVSRFSLEIPAAFLLTVAAFLYECTPKKPLHRRRALL